MKDPVIPRKVLFPFILLTLLFFAWAVPNNLTDTMLAAFKRIMSLSDAKTAWIQVVSKGPPRRLRRTRPRRSCAYVRR